MFWFHPEPWWEAMQQCCVRETPYGFMLLFELGVPEAMVSLCKGRPEVFSVCPLVLLHPTWGCDTLADKNLLEGVDAVRRMLEESPPVNVLFHADLFTGRPDLLLAAQKKLGSEALLLENMGSQACSARTLGEIRSLLVVSPEVGFVLDTAHLWETDPEGARVWMHDPLIRERLKMVHVSTSRQAIKEPGALPREIRTASHVPAFLEPAFPDAESKRALSEYPLIAEGCLPRGPKGQEFWEREKTYLLNWGRP